MTQRYVLGIDQGSSGSRAVVLDAAGHAVGYGYQPVRRLYPQSGWVEQDPREIAESVRAAVAAAIAQAGCEATAIAGCGITSQRDTVFAWDRETGRPIGNAITWQDLRTIPLVAEANGWEHAGERRDRLGQFPGPYCSAMHMAWRMRHDEAFRRAADDGRLQTSLSTGWVIHALGRLNGNPLDYSMMQAMTVYDYKNKRLWQEWLDYLHIPAAALPTAVPTIHSYGELDLVDARGGRAAVPVLAMIADQQASLFGFDCRSPGQAVCTHGTGSYMHVVVGPEPPKQGLTKIYRAWELDGVPTYAVEADTTVTGAVVRWMQEQMGFFASPAGLDPLAASVDDPGGVVFVPAFIGLAMPYEDRSARGTLLGMTLDTTPAHVARAFMEALGCLVYDMLRQIEQETGLHVDRLHVGGGVSASDLACQTQADVLGIPVIRVEDAETSVRAAALLGGLGAGVWPDLAGLPPLPGATQAFEPRRSAATREAGLAAWRKGIDRARNWAEPQ
ncbi:MAG TPA: FGGY family carbohydrate kinase [Roseiflexaceae bacterium]|nr:FGGY family carbohydrate kinase [Roseiflexaceae bacterium]